VSGYEPEAGSDVRLRDVNVAAGGHGGRTLTHKPGKMQHKTKKGKPPETERRFCA